MFQTTLQGKRLEHTCIDYFWQQATTPEVFNDSNLT